MYWLSWAGFFSRSNSIHFSSSLALAEIKAAIFSAPASDQLMPTLSYWSFLFLIGNNIPVIFPHPLLPHFQLLRSHFHAWFSRAMRTFSPIISFVEKSSGGKLTGVFVRDDLYIESMSSTAFFPSRVFIRGVVMTSSSGPIPRALSVSTRASVPLATATACFTPRLGGHFLFKLFYVGAHDEVNALYDFRYGRVYFIFYGFILGF